MRRKLSRPTSASYSTTSHTVLWITLEARIQQHKNLRTRRPPRVECSIVSREATRGRSRVTLSILHPSQSSDELDKFRPCSTPTSPSKHTSYVADITNVLSQSLVTVTAHTQIGIPALTVRSLTGAYIHIPAPTASYPAGDVLPCRSVVLWPRALYRTLVSSEHVLSSGRLSMAHALPHPPVWRRPVSSGASSMAHAPQHPRVWPRPISMGVSSMTHARASGRVLSSGASSMTCALPHPCVLWPRHTIRHVVHDPCVYICAPVRFRGRACHPARRPENPRASRPRLSCSPADASSCIPAFVCPLAISCHQVCRP